MRAGVRMFGFRMVAVMLASGFAAGLWATAGAIDSMDQLHRGQDLVDLAARRIDARAAALREQVGDRDALYRGIRSLSAWEMGFASDTVGVRYALGSPEGILIRDGIADTLTVRLGGVLDAYVEAFPDELLDTPRQAFEIATAEIPVPPGRFLGFHFVELALLLGAQADTVVAVLDRQEDHPDPAGVQDGFLRHLRDLTELYRQTHSSSVEKYFSRVVEEDWIVQRLRSSKCGERGFRVIKVNTGMKDDPSEACTALLYGADREKASLMDRLRCRHWGHVFQAVCDACADTVEYSVPLPYYRLFQIERALGETELPDLSPYFHKKGQTQEEETGTPSE